MLEKYVKLIIKHPVLELYILSIMFLSKIISFLDVIVIYNLSPTVGVYETYQFRICYGFKKQHYRKHSIYIFR